MLKKRKITAENIIALVFWVICIFYPLFHTAYDVNNFTYYFIMIIFMLSLYILWGFTGIFSFGQAAFLGIGAYTYGIISKANPDNSGMTMLAMLCAVLVTAVFAGILGAFIYYGHINASFVGVITFCLSLTLQTFMTQTSGPEWQIAGVQLGGFNGMQQIPALQIGSIKIMNTEMFYVCLVISCIAYIVFRILQKSKAGYTMFSVRENPQRSELFGYNTAFISTVVFAAGGAIAGLAGVLFASWGSYVVPSTLGTSMSLTGIVIIALAGRHTVTASVIMTFLYVAFMRTLAFSGNMFSQVIEGALLVIIVLFFPKGIGHMVFHCGDVLIEKTENKIKTLRGKR